MLKNNGQKKKKNTIKIKKLIKIKQLRSGDKFTLGSKINLKGVLLDVNNSIANVYWYSVPERWFKKNYNSVTLLDKYGRYYEGLDVYYFRKKTVISPDTEVIKINAKLEGKEQKAK